MGRSTATDAPRAVALQEADLPRRSRSRIASRLTEHRRQIAVWILRGAIAVIFLVSWHAAVDQHAIDRFFFSSPGAVWTSFLSVYTSGRLWLDLEYTLLEVVLGFGIGSAAGIAAGLVLARFTIANDVIGPYLSGLNALPRVALAPLFILWFGLGLASKVWLAVSLVFFIVLVSTESGVKSVDANLITVARTLNASTRQVFRKVILPAAVPSIIGGLRLGFVYSLLGVVFGEMLSAQYGLGAEITYFSGVFNVGGVFAMVTLLALLSVLLNWVILSVERWLLRWK